MRGLGRESGLAASVSWRRGKIEKLTDARVDDDGKVW